MLARAWRLARPGRGLPRLLSAAAPARPPLQLGLGRRARRAAVAGVATLSGVGLATASPLLAPARCEGEPGAGGWGLCAKAGCCCVVTAVGGLWWLSSAVQAAMQQMALDMVELAGRQVPLTEAELGPGRARVQAALRADPYFREHVPAEQQAQAARLLVEVLRLTFGLACLAQKLKGMPEDIAEGERDALLENSERDPSLPMEAVVNGIGGFTDTVLQGAEAPPLWQTLFAWLSTNLLAVDTADDGVVDWAEFVSWSAYAVAQICAQRKSSEDESWEGAPEEQLQEQAKLLFSVLSADSGHVASIPRPELVEWVRAMVVLGLLPLDDMDREHRRAGFLRRASAAVDHGSVDGTEALTQQLCVEVGINDPSAPITTKQFESLVQRLDFSNWQAMGEDVREVLGPQLAPGRQGVGVLCAQMAELILVASTRNKQVNQVGE